ncbi:MAG: oligoendopeptidase F [Clostridia bacterium]
MLRNEVKECDKWKLEDIFASDIAWEKEFNELSKKYAKIAKFSGKLNNKNDILACLKFEDELSLSVSRLYVYANMRKDEDTAKATYQALTARIETLSVQIASASSFVVPELVALDSNFLLELASCADFADYDYSLKNLVREKPHILSSSEEKILAEVGGFSSLFKNAFGMFDNADVKFKNFKTADGKKVEMSHGAYSTIMQSDNRNDRVKAFNSMFNAYKGMINTVSTLYAGNVKKNCFYAKVRKYSSPLDEAMESEDIDKTVYTNLLDNVHKNIGVLHEYLDYRKQVLGYDKLHMYDLHMPLVNGTSLGVKYEEAIKIVKEALKPLGEEYGKLLDNAFNDGWIDVYETKNKRSGAYSWGTYGVHPYVLLNHQETLHDVFTIAHELGHAMHSYYSNKNQCHNKASYEIFVAEVASTVNEVLLLKYLMAKADKETKKYLLTYFLDMFRTTLFRQTQFAEFEKVAHDMALLDKPITAETLSKAYFKINKFYYGKNVISDKLIQYEWARIPHFYNAFYVYKYSTGIISAVSIANNILTNKKDATEGYKKFLCAGGSMSPVEILKLAEVDLTKQQPYEVAFNVMKTTLDDLKKL